MHSISCPFCQLDPDKIIFQNDLAVAFFDGYPVNPGHVLVVPRRHVENFFASSQEEKIAICQLLETCKKILDKSRKPGGYNVGINIGQVAGQTVMHFHVHLIPRYKGDIDDPRGGVRGVIPSKRIYQPENSSIDG